MLPRPRRHSFDDLRAGTYDEVVQLLQKHGPETRLMMGGTGLTGGAAAILVTDN